MYGSKRSGRSSARNSRSAREPWLLVSSPALQHLSPDAIINLYAQRMKIEQSFRDTKNTRVGLGLENARSRSGARFEMLLLIAHLASFVQRLIGECARGLLKFDLFLVPRKTRLPRTRHNRFVLFG